MFEVYNFRMETYMVGVSEARFAAGAISHTPGWNQVGRHLGKPVTNLV